MRVLIVTSFSDRSELAIYSGLCQTGIELHILCDPEATGFEAVAEAGATIERLSVRGRADLHALRVIRRQLVTGGYDLFYAPNNHTLQLSHLAATGLRIGRVTYRGTMGHLSWFDPASWLTYLHPRLNRTVCVSDAVRRYLRSMGVPERRLQVIYKGHDVAWYENRRAASLAEFGIPAGAFVVGFAGNMRPVKGADILLRAAALLPAHLPVHLLLVGAVRDSRIAPLAANPAVRDRVHLAGYRADAAALMGACHVFVMPSIAREGLPRAVIEAMSQGIPPVVSNVGGMPELVVDGVSGRVVPPRDPQALADALVRLASDPEEVRRLGQGARERVVTNFNLVNTVREYKELFTRISQETGRH